VWRFSPERTASRPSRRQTLLGGLVGVTLYFTLENLGVQLTTAGDAALLMAAIPIIALVAEAVWFKQPIHWRRGVAIVVSIAGVFLVIAPASGLGGTNRLLGNLLVLVAALAWAVYSIIGKSLQQYSKLTVVTHQSIYGTLMLLPLALTEAAEWQPVTLTGSLSILYLGLMCSAVTYLLYNYALKTLAASQVTAFLNLVPIIGVITAAMVLSEPIHPIQALGGGIILAGVIASTRTRREPSPSTADRRSTIAPAKPRPLSSSNEVIGAHRGGPLPDCGPIGRTRCPSRDQSHVP
jgi:drug/metabolite transporter (DMT)-like permease